MNALVAGYGRSGKAAEALLKAQGHAVAVLADDRRDTVEAALAALGGAADVVIVSPGVALTHPWLVDAKARGIPFKSELQLGCETLKSAGWKLLAVTGSKGKSSVVKIVADAIALSGSVGVPCGNYGLPVCEVACTHLFPSSESDNQTIFKSSNSFWAVVEVSSFMMETTELPADAFEAAAVLNLQEDHLDRHGSVEVYHGLKRRLLTMAKKGFLCEAPESTLPAGSYFDNPILKTNGELAVALMRSAGLVDATCAAAFRGFEPLAHRMNLVAERDGVRYIDDSKATSLAALAAGVVMASSGVSAELPCVRLIAGGLPKGDDPKSVIPILTERVKKVYIIGQCAEAFDAAWREVVDCEICGNMKGAVAAVKREAEKGDVVLLSPGTASFDQFKSFGERGEVFAGLVTQEG